jgi:hypothetical protein
MAAAAANTHERVRTPDLTGSHLIKLMITEFSSVTGRVCQIASQRQVMEARGKQHGPNSASKLIKLSKGSSHIVFRVFSVFRGLISGAFAAEVIGQFSVYCL